MNPEGSVTYLLAHRIAITNDNKLVVGGHATVSGAGQLAVARYSFTGVLDTTFSSDGKVLVPFSGFDLYGYPLAIDSSTGKLLPGGTDF